MRMDTKSLALKQNLIFPASAMGKMNLCLPVLKIDRDYYSHYPQSSRGDKELQNLTKEQEIMSTQTKEILNQALGLPPIEKARLVDCLLSSLDKPDEAIDNLWREEVEKRLEAHQAGKLNSVSLSQVLSKYQQ